MTWSRSPAGVCRACGAPMLWAKMPSGRLNPLNLEEVEPRPSAGVVAYNPTTGNAIPVINANIDECPKWAESGATFHTSHFATCEHAGRFHRAEPTEPTAAVKGGEHG